jgi:hypothetical protein
VSALPHCESEQQRQIAYCVDRERRFGPRRKDDESTQSRAEAARDAVADRAERNGGWQVRGLNLFADRGLPGRRIDRHAGAN